MILDFLFSIFLFFLLPVLWLIREIKAVNFWLYLWQLKEYHIGRFIDHFRTSHGQKLLFDKLVFLKVVLILVVAFGIPYILDTFDPEDYLHLDLRLGFSVFGIIFLVYLLEGLKAARDFFGRSLRIPVPTKKIIALRLFLFFIIVLWWASPLLGLFLRIPSPYMDPVLGMLLYDVLTPFVVAVVVLMLQPFAVLGKRRIIQKATKKRATLPNLKVVGITGSYGKTSTKEFLFAILQKKFRVVKTPEHRNSEVGVSQTILQDLKDDTEIFICEMGAYNKGGIKLLASIARPNIAILTGANEQHLATFGSMENLLSAEGGQELVDSLPENGTVIFNGSNKYTQELYEKSTISRKILSGKDIRAENLTVEKERISFNLVFGQENVVITANLLGGYNTENLLLAIAGAKEFGMTLAEIADVCKTITPEMGAMKLKKGISGLNVIDSIYSANPDGVIAALEYLKVWPGKKVIVMPCLIELGKASKEVHKRIGEKIAEVCDLAIITTREHFQDVKEGARQSEKVIYMESSQEILEKVKGMVKEGDAVLLEGGKESRVQRQLLALLSKND
ncbi:MAG: hypothetical protein Greene071421_536 [Parcubacteria group bacterium Greene0714_21]|nr:MAG: hypothetical protein Greene041639_546 [Parcubacteria group bacterium Greene0416_39]TSC97647.1 MAG: hypothetical protein Greene101447_394 [Parcubacteria group bacterium Greene1014_47]TSD03877.1 MAG: hypothetical protein Greene071421_536 [Parcubacteria group bacterium Greene0714_21]